MVLISRKQWTWITYLGLAIAFLGRLGLMLLPYDFRIDIGTFKSWIAGLINYGLADFYGLVWTDYPPGYMYVLWLTGKFYTLFDPNFLHTDDLFLTFLIKLAPAIADMVAALLILQILTPLVSNARARIAALTYAFNPVVIFVSVVWGQVDGAISLMMLLVMWLLQRNQFAIAAMVGAVSVIVKPQGLFLLPIFLLSQWQKRSIWEWIVAIALGFISVWLLVLPFVGNQINFADPNFVIMPFQFLYKQFSSGASVYPYASVNGFNIWAWVNWKSDAIEVWGISYRAIGLGLLGMVTIGTGIFLRKRPNGIYLATSVMMMAIFMLATRMHERYIFYAIAFLLISSAYKLIPWGIYIGVTFTSAINIFYAYVRYNHQALFDQLAFMEQGIIWGTSAMNLCLFLALLGYMFFYRSDSHPDAIESIPESI